MTDEEVKVRDTASTDHGRAESESGKNSAWTAGALCAHMVHRCGYRDGNEKVVPRGGVDEFEKQPGGISRLAHAGRRRSGIGERVAVA